ncbi:MAG: hypothetical protein HYV92_12410 [Candidatus Rokubacteria bacterium]|nr:hypothetical protein [Candidatus Rokubacteria bacterium]
MRRGWAVAVLLLLLLGVAAAAEPPSPEEEAPTDTPVTTPPPPPAGEIALAPGGRWIPWERLDEDSFALVRDVVGQALVFREVEGIAFRSRKEVYDYLIQHMDFAADVARTLRVGKYRIRRTADGFEADDGRGAHGVLRPLYDDGDRRVFYLQGRYDPPILPIIAGRLVLVLETNHTLAPDGENYAEMRVAGYLRLDSVLAELIATVAQSFSEEVVKRKVKRFFRHVARVSRRAYDDPEGLIEELARHPELEAERVAEFRQVLLAHRLPDWAESIPFRLTPDPLALDPGDLPEPH